MTVTFNENASFVTTIVPSEVMTALVSLDAIMAFLNSRIRPTALKVINNFFLPIPHRFEGTADGGMVDSSPLFTPMYKTPFRKRIARRAVIPLRECFFPFPYTTQ